LTCLTVTDGNNSTISEGSSPASQLAMMLSSTVSLVPLSTGRPRCTSGLVSTNGHCDQSTLVMLRLSRALVIACRQIRDHEQPRPAFECHLAKTAECSSQCTNSRSRCQPGPLDARAWTSGPATQSSARSRSTRPRAGRQHDHAWPGDVERDNAMPEWAPHTDWNRDVL